jgi:hypothetical protein
VQVEPGRFNDHSGWEVYPRSDDFTCLCSIESSGGGGFEIHGKGGRSVESGVMGAIDCIGVLSCWKER